ALGGHKGEYLPHIAKRFVVVTPVAPLVHALDQAPFDQLAQVHAYVATRDAEPGHDVVHRERSTRDVEKAVDLRHRGTYAPQRAHGAPEADELFLDFIQSPGHLRLLDFHEFYSF